MMKVAASGNTNSIRAYPYIVSSIDTRRNRRWPVLMANGPVPEPNDGTWVIAGSGTVGRDGTPTAVGRRALFRAIAERARTSEAHYGIVWNEHACTFFLADGSTVEGLNPPLGEGVPEEPGYDSSPILCEPVWSVALRGRGPGYLCISRAGRFVEVSAGARLVLADFRDFAPGGDQDPAAALRTPEGKWKTGGSWRGQPIYDIIDNGLVLGPVQPLEHGESIILRSPWPHQLEDACNQVAGRRLPKAVLNAAWAEVDSRGESLPLVDVLDAA
ncbi:MAG TPA: hypothetical protein VE053_01645 [Allosphingosinicella sp.]|nr:hypothetical protein [Allosphingosinicella sp.]